MSLSGVDDVVVAVAAKVVVVVIIPVVVVSVVTVPAAVIVVVVDVAVARTEIFPDNLIAENLIRIYDQRRRCSCLLLSTGLQLMQ